MDWDKDSKQFLHQNGKSIIHTKLSESISNVLSIKYQEIPPYTATITQVKFENQPQLDADTNYIIWAKSEFTDNNPNLEGFPALIKYNTLHNSPVLLIISINSDNNIWISKDIIL